MIKNLVVPLIMLLSGPMLFTRTDHQLHMITSYGMSMTMTTILRKNGLSRLHAVLLSSAATMALGAAKETLIDQRGERGDIVANAVGIGAQAAVVYTFSL